MRRPGNYSKPTVCTSIQSCVMKSCRSSTYTPMLSIGLTLLMHACGLVHCGDEASYANEVPFQKLYPPPLAVVRILVPGAASVIQLPKFEKLAKWSLESVALTATADDFDGNSASVGPVTVRLDQTKPTVTRGPVAKFVAVTRLRPEFLLR